MARTRNAQVSKFNATAIGGLVDVSVERGFGRIVAGALDGQQGAPFAVARGDKLLQGVINHQDIEKMVTLLTSVPGAANSEWYEKEVGADTFAKHLLKNPVFGPLSFSSGVGQKAAASQQYQCRWGSGDDFKDMHVKTTGVTAATVDALGPIVPVSAGDPIGLVYVQGGADPDITIAHLQGFNFNLGGEFVTDSDPGATGREAVDFQPQELTFSVTYRDVSLATGEDKAEQLFGAGSATGTLRIELEVKGATTNTFITLANARFTGSPRRSSSRGFVEFTIDGQCDWNKGTTLYKLTGANLMILITPST